MTVIVYAYQIGYIPFDQTYNYIPRVRMTNYISELPPNIWFVDTAYIFEVIYLPFTRPDL